MSKNKTIFVCRQCGYEAFKWLGYCPNCQGWNTIEEEIIPAGSPAKTSRPGKTAGGLQRLDEIESLAEARFLTGINELDRVLGGGAVAGTVVLVGGDPGIGKSTLLLQAALGMASRKNKVLYVSGEESPAQIKMRAERLGAGEEPPLMVLAETEYSHIAAQIKQYNPGVVIIDSIQTILKGELGSVPGSVVQIREITAALVQLAKSKQVIFFIVGHVTKEGILAGPRLLEHMVDCVLYFEGERYQNFRILRGVKNRFGATNEIGIFTMESSGLQEVQNPSALFLSRQPTGEPGSAVAPIMEGTRPLLVEIQGLVTPSYFGGTPRRTATGLDFNRVAITIAVLEKRTGLKLYNCDIFINVVGGVRIMEPAADLAAALCLASSFMDKPLPEGMMVVGEVGLTGEVRPVNRIEERLREGAKMGFKRCLLPRSNISAAFTGNMKTWGGDLEILDVATLAQALKLALA